MNDYIAWMIVVAILGSAVGYIILQKRKGVKCIGCASEAKCSCEYKPHDPCACHTQFETTCACEAKESP